MYASTRSKYFKVLKIYDTIVEEAGEYAPYLASEYFIENTVTVAKGQNIPNVSRTIVYKALRLRNEIQTKMIFSDDF